MAASAACSPCAMACVATVVRRGDGTPLPASRRIPRSRYRRGRKSSLMQAEIAPTAIVSLPANKAVGRRVRARMLLIA